MAMLEGMKSVAASTDFVPAVLEASPEIFSDGSISEQNPLWEARMRGRAAFTWPGDELALGIMPLSPGQLEAMALGERFYLQCGTCHSADGAGIAGLAPSLVGAIWVTGPPEWLARIILQGLNGPVKVKGEIWNGVMPAHGHLSELNDETLAGLMTYVRRSWGNKADPVSVTTAAESRAASADRMLPWTVAELQSVPYDRGYGSFEGAYSISFVTFTVIEKSDGLHLEVPMYGGGLMEPLSATTFMAGAGGENVKLEFIADEDGAVNTMLMYRKGEKILIKRKE
jgi:mono/diheme cytochrome c family protein